MNIQTARFGLLEIEADDILFFRDGLFGFESCQHWVLLADAANRQVAWLQNLQHPNLALPVVSPRRHVPSYQIRVNPRDMAALGLQADEHAYALAVVGRDGDRLTLNLRAPVLLNLERRLGCQIVTVDEQPVQYVLGTAPQALRRSA